MNLSIDVGKLDKGSLMLAIAEIDREVATRYRVYPKWVAEKKITQRDAELRTAALQVARMACVAIAKGMAKCGTRSAECGAGNIKQAEGVTVSPSPCSQTNDAEKPPMTNDSAIAAARAAIVEAAGTTRPQLGFIPCPICHKATLNFAIAPNGHITAACTNDACVRWRE